MKKFLFMFALAFFIMLPFQVEANNTFVYTDVKDSTNNNILLKLVNEEIITVPSNRIFKPSETITRAEMAVIINKAFDLEVIREPIEFTDVSKSHPNYTDIQALYQAGIIDGSNGKFNPKQPVKRAHVAKVIVNTLGLSQQSTSKFKDVARSNEFNGYIGALVNKQITQGYVDGTFKPQNAVTRMQFATFVYRSLYGKEQIIEKEKRKITSGKVFAPTKLKSAKVTINFFKYPYNTFTMKFDKDGNTDLGQTVGQPLVYYGDYIVGQQDSTDYRFFQLDFTNLEEGKTYIEYTPYGKYENSVTFDETLTVAGQKFTDVVMYKSINRSSGDTWTYGLKEGYGIVYIKNNHQFMWYYNSMQLR